jgi:SAM-dependent methyltransferase
MFSESAEFYDLIYSQFKSYAEESARLAALLLRANPGCRSVLDVACGTGEHVRHLSAQPGFRVDGLDLDQRFLDIARQKNPDARFWQGDMAAFDLPERYDAVVCLFSSIGYLRTLDRVERALRCFRKHAAVGGLIVVEPWFGPGQLDPSRVMRTSAEANGVHVERVSRIEIDGRLSRILFDYHVTDATGVRTATEVHELGLFTPEEMRASFAAAGLQVDYDETGLDGRGLYLAHA